MLPSELQVWWRDIAVLFLTDQSSVLEYLSSMQTFLYCMQFNIICLLTICNATAVDIPTTFMWWLHEFNDTLPTSVTGALLSDYTAAERGLDRAGLVRFSVSALSDLVGQLGHHIKPACHLAVSSYQSPVRVVRRWAISSPCTSRVSHTCFFHLLSLRSYCRQLDGDVTDRLVGWLCLDHCNAVLAGLSASTLTPLRRILRATAWTVLDLKPGEKDRYTQGAKLNFFKQTWPAVKGWPPETISTYI